MRISDWSSDVCSSDLTPAQFGHHLFAKAPAVHCDEQIAAARKQPPHPVPPLFGVEAKAADIGRAIKIGDKVQNLGAKGAAKLRRAQLGSAWCMEEVSRSG